MPLYNSTHLSISRLFDMLLLILERPQRAECHLSLVDVTEHRSHNSKVFSLSLKESTLEMIMHC